MFDLVFSALRERRSQAVSLFVLTILAALGGCAAPWFAGWAHEAVASADISAAPVSQRLVTVTGPALKPTVASPPMGQLRQLVESALPVTGGDVVVAMSVFAQVYADKSQTPGSSPPTNSPFMPLAARDDVCAHLTVTGACPSAPGQVVIGRRMAATFGVGVGDRLTFAAPSLPRPLHLTISGLFEVTDGLSLYWAGGGAYERPLDQTAFVTERGLLADAPLQVDLQYQVVLAPSAFRDSGDPLLAQLTAAHNRLQPEQLSVNTTATRLVDQIRTDQSLVATGVYLAAVQLVLLGWFALYLAVRHASHTRRRDIGLLKMRGAAGWRVWALIALQSGIPMLAGTMVGLGLGRLASIALAGSAADPGAGRALETSLLVAGGIGLGALLVCVSAEVRALRSPVTTLIRRVPSRRAGWRTELGDLLVVVVAVAGVYQGYADLRDGGRPSTFSLLAPGLVGLAVAVLAARVLPIVAARGGRAALGAGRVALALTALHVARRPGTQRVFAVIAVSVSVFATTLFFWQSATDAWGRRAVAELGAARVLTVTAQNSTVLLADVRSADPTGRYAMAVARGVGVSPANQVLAVDTTRLAAVAELSPEFGLPAAASLARLLRPPAPASPTLTDGQVTLDATASTPVSGATIVMDLVDPAGGWHSVTFGPLATAARAHPAAGVGAHAPVARPAAATGYSATVTGCAAGCRLAAFELGDDRPGVSVTLSGLTQPGRSVVSAEEFATIARWRPPTDPKLVGPAIGTGSGGLTISGYGGTTVRADQRDPHVYLAAAPTPLPVALVGDLTDTASRPGDARLNALGTEPVAYSVVSTGRLMPRLGVTGALMDLQYAQLSNSGPSESAGLEVWLTADAPSSIVDRLRRDGIQVISDDSTAAYVGRLRGQGPGAALRFEIFAAIVLLLVAAGTIAVSASVERQPRAEELATLRAQGLSGLVVRRVIYAGTGVLAATAVAVGLLAALVAQAVVTTSLPVFSDSWSLLPVREGPWAGQLIIALFVSLVVLGAAVWWGAAGTVRRTRDAVARAGGLSAGGDA